MIQTKKVFAFLILANIFGLQIPTANGEHIATHFNTVFDMIETDCPGRCVTTITGATGSGMFSLDIGTNLFELTVDAQNLIPDHNYVVQLTVTKGAFGGSDPDPIAGYAFRVVAETNDQGVLNLQRASTLDVRAIFPEGDPAHPNWDPNRDGWRIDQQIFDQDISDGLNTPQNYSLVCTPTTRVFIPEPSTFGLATIGLIGLIAGRRRNKFVLSRV